MIRLAYYWTDYGLEGYINAIGTHTSTKDAVDYVLSFPPAGRVRLSPWYPGAFAPDLLARRMGQDWNPSFDFCVVIENHGGRPLGYLMRSPSQTIDPEEYHD